MRITGGRLQGRQVKVPPGILRPAMDRMRESVFGIIGDLSGFSFLDIFSGSGIIALEAASRGAEYIEAIENDPLKRKTILENIKISPTRINCHFISAELYIKRAKKPFGFIFCDPPFPYKYKWELIKKIANSPIMDGDSCLILHFPKEDFVDFPPDGLDLVNFRKFGRSNVGFFKKKPK